MCDNNDTFNHLLIVVGIYTASINNDRVDRSPATKGPAPDILTVDRHSGYLVMVKDHQYHIGKVLLQASQEDTMIIVMYRLSHIGNMICERTFLSYKRNAPHRQMGEMIEDIDGWISTHSTKGLLAMIVDSLRDYAEPFDAVCGNQYLKVLLLRQHAHAQRSAQGKLTGTWSPHPSRALVPSVQRNDSPVPSVQRNDSPGSRLAASGSYQSVVVSCISPGIVSTTRDWPHEFSRVKFINQGSTTFISRYRKGKAQCLRLICKQRVSSRDIRPRDWHSPESDIPPRDRHSPEIGIRPRLTFHREIGIRPRLAFHREIGIRPREAFARD
ncbi:hypothetical protein ACLB2K_046401 [Fragaria x ananassa]